MCAKRRNTKNSKNSKGTGNSRFENIFKGKTIALSGRFRSNPSKKELEKWICDQGGKLTEQIDSDLNILIVDGEKTTKMQTEAEALVRSGHDIQILTSVSELLSNTDLSPSLWLTNSKDLQRIAEWLESGWPLRFLPAEEGLLFKKQKIGIDDSSTRVELSSLCLSQCSFIQCHLHNLEVLGNIPYLRTCRFDATEFRNVALKCELDSSIRDCNGSLTLKDFSDSELTGGHFESLHLSRLERANISKVAVDTMHLNGWSNHSNFRDMSIKETHLKSSFNYSEFNNFQSHSGQSTGYVSFENCKLTDVRFDAHKFGSLEFKDCELTNCTFERCESESLALGNSKLSGCLAKDCSFGMPKLTESQLAGFSGLKVPAFLEKPPIGKKLAAFADSAMNSQMLEFSFTGTCVSGGQVEFRFNRQEFTADISFSKIKDQKHRGTVDLASWDGTLTSDQITSNMHWLLSVAQVGDIDLTKFKSKASKCKLSPQKLKHLIIDAVYEVIGKQHDAKQSLKSATRQVKERLEEQRQFLAGLLVEGGVTQLNKNVAELKACSPLKKIKLPKKTNLSQLKLNDIALEQCDFTDVDLQKAALSGSSWIKCKLTRADLTGADLRKAKFRDTDLSMASLSKCRLAGVDFSNTNLEKANFSGAIFGSPKSNISTNLRGLNLSTANLEGAKLHHAFYDNETKLPSTLSDEQLSQLDWRGRGKPPHHRKKNSNAGTKIDFTSFLERLAETTGKSRLAAARQMLKKDAFQLFVEVTPNRLSGIVSSQRGKELVYACTLNSKGHFSCCSHKLNPCGGLRGTACKHLLVLLIGLTKEGKLSPNKADTWINKSRDHAPELDRDSMADLLLKYKQARDGEIDWRPTETVPEDFVTI